MSKKKKWPNPKVDLKMPDIGNLLTWGVLGIAAYGGYRVYQATQGTTVTQAQRCADAGGIWIPSPADPTGASGTCRLARV